MTPGEYWSAQSAWLLHVQLLFCCGVMDRNANDVKALNSPGFVSVLLWPCRDTVLAAFQASSFTKVLVSSFLSEHMPTERVSVIQECEFIY